MRLRSVVQALAVPSLVLVLATAGWADITSGELLGRPTDGSVTVNAVADEDLEVYFEAGTEPGLYTVATETASFAAGVPIEMVIGGLSPDTRYYYRMRYRSPGAGAFLARPEHTFRTRRSSGRTFTFTIQSDSHIYDKKGNGPLYAIAVENQLADSPDFVFDLGDTFGDDHDLAIGASEMLALHLAQRPYLGIAGHSAPIFLVLGNHEGEGGYYLDGGPDNLAVYGTLARQLYYPNPVPDGFYTGNETEEPHVGRPENYYAFTWGDALFVALDVYRHATVDPKASGDLWDSTLGKEQYDWLVETLSTSRARHKFVFLHHLLGQTRGGVRWAGMYEWGGIGKDGTDEFDAKRPGWGLPVHDLLVANGVTAVFSGHDHVFAREELDGIAYVEVPMPSDATYAVGSPNADDYLGDVLLGSGHVRVTVAPARVTVDYVSAFLPGDGVNGEVAYSFSIAGDLDGDGALDEDDPCTMVPEAAGQAAAGLKVSLSGLAEAGGGQGLSASGTFVPATGGPDLDPGVHGVHVRVTDAAGEVYDVSIPGGLAGTLPSDPRDGWTVKESGGKRRWTYANRSGTANGIRQIVIRELSAEPGSAVAFKVAAKDAAFTAIPVAPVTLLHFTLALGARDAAGKASAQAVLGQCTEATTAGSPPPGLKASPADAPPRTIRWSGP